MTLRSRFDRRGATRALGFAVAAAATAFLASPHDGPLGRSLFAAAMALLGFVVVAVLETLP